MKTRIIAGLCMVPLLAIVYIGKVPLLVAAALIALIGINEFFNIFESKDVKPSKWIARIMILLLYGSHLILDFKIELLAFWVVASVFVSLLYGLNIKDRGPFDSIVTIAGIMYIAFFPYHIVLLDGTKYRYMVWMVLFAAFGSDIFAYFTGSFFGKHKMAPVLSPKKSIEGAIGGIIGAGILGTLFGILVMKDLWYHCLIVGIIGAIISECGDLVASSFKRQMGIKDYGNLIPGHGGIMDRFDSVIFVAPAVYYYVLFVMIGMN